MYDFLKKMLARLTDNYNKDPSSNIGKLMNLVSGEMEEIKTALDTTEEYRDIDLAEGTTLDRIGMNVQQFRGAANDGVYRILLKSKIARNLSTGDINTIINILAITLSTEPKNIYIRELYEDENPEPAALFISLPTVLLNQIGFSIVQFGRLVNKIVAAGVRANVLFQGTFAFSSQNSVSEADNTKGLSDILQSSGGYFGAVYDPVNDVDLPL